MTSPRDAGVKLNKSLMVNMLKYEATSKDSHFPPLPRSVIDEMVHRSETRVRTKPPIRSVPDSVKLYQKMKQRGIFTVGLSADSKVADPSFKVGTKGFNLSNLPDSITYTCTKQLKDEVWVEVKSKPSRKQVKRLDDGLIWPKYTRNNTFILPKLNYGEEEKKKMKSLVETEETKPPDIPEQSHPQKDGVKIDDSPKTLKLILIGEDIRKEAPSVENGDNNKPSIAPKEEASPRPALRSVTIGGDLPHQSTEAMKKKEIRSMYPMYDTLEEKREYQRHNWWEKRSKTQIPVRTPRLEIVPAPFNPTHSIMASGNEEKPLRILTVNKDYVMADELEERTMKNTDSEVFTKPGVFEKYLQAVKSTIIGDKPLTVTGINPTKTTSQSENRQVAQNRDNIREPNCNVNGNSLEHGLPSVPQVSEPDATQRDDGTGKPKPHGPVRRNSSFLDLPESPRDPHERPPSKESVDIPMDHQPLIRRTSSYLELPEVSSRDPLERAPSVESQGNNQPEVSPACEQLTRRQTPEILVSTEAEKPDMTS